MVKILQDSRAKVQKAHQCSAEFLRVKMISRLHYKLHLNLNFFFFHFIKVMVEIDFSHAETHKNVEIIPNYMVKFLKWLPVTILKFKFRKKQTQVSDPWYLSCRSGLSYSSERASPPSSFFFKKVLQKPLACPCAKYSMSQNKGSPNWRFFFWTS